MLFLYTVQFCVGHAAMTQQHLPFLHCYRLSDEMDPKILDAIADFMNSNKVSYKWQKVIILQGSVLFLFLINSPMKQYFPHMVHYRATSLQLTTGEGQFVHDRMLCLCTIPYPPPASIGLTDLSCTQGIRLRDRGEFMHPCLAIFSGQTWQKEIVLER